MMMLTKILASVMGILVLVVGTWYMTYIGTVSDVKDRLILQLDRRKQFPRRPIKPKPRVKQSCTQTSEVEGKDPYYIEPPEPEQFSGVTLGQIPFFTPFPRLVGDLHR